MLNVKDSGAVGDGLADDTAAIQSAIDAAALLRSATVYFPAGNYKITSTLTVGDRINNAFVTINLMGDGTIATILRWQGASSGVLMKYWRNKSAVTQGLAWFNALPTKGTTVGLHLTGPGNGTQSNQHVFTNCEWNAFDVGVQAGGGAQAASELEFRVCSFLSNNTGWKGMGTGNTLNVWFRGCGFTQNTQYGADIWSASSVYFWGGATHGNGNAAIKCSSWQVNLEVNAMRFELTPPEVAVELNSALDCATISHCHFHTTAAVPTYPVIRAGGGPVATRLIGNTFGNGGTGWMSFGGVDNGAARYLEMVGNHVYGDNAFDIGSASTGCKGLRYSLRGNTYGGIMHGIENGVVVWPNRVNT